MSVYNIRYNLYPLSMHTVNRLQAAIAILSITAYHDITLPHLWNDCSHETQHHCVSIGWGWTHLQSKSLHLDILVHCLVQRNYYYQLQVHLQWMIQMHGYRLISAHKVLSYLHWLFLCLITFGLKTKLSTNHPCFPISPSIITDSAPFSP